MLRSDSSTDWIEVLHFLSRRSVVIDELDDDAAVAAFEAFEALEAGGMVTIAENVDGRGWSISLSEVGKLVLEGFFKGAVQ